MHVCGVHLPPPTTAHAAYGGGWWCSSAARTVGQPPTRCTCMSTGGALIRGQGGQKEAGRGGRMGGTLMAPSLVPPSASKNVGSAACSVNLTVHHAVASGNPCGRGTSPGGPPGACIQVCVGIAETRQHAAGRCHHTQQAHPPATHHPPSSLGCPQHQPVGSKWAAVVPHRQGPAASPAGVTHAGRQHQGRQPPAGAALPPAAGRGWWG